MNKNEFVPKTISCLREGYSLKALWGDLFAGISVGIIALPLALAFAIGSGVAPEKGIYTAIIAGFLISLLGGSRVQIGGPTGAFVVIIYAIIQKHGYDGLALATLLAAVMMILMGMMRLGVLLKFIPYPVTTGFTTGIAVVILLSQLNEFLGLAPIPTDGAATTCSLLCIGDHSWNPWSFLIAAVTLGLIVFFKYRYPRFPGVIAAIATGTLLTYIFQLPIPTIESRFGTIPHELPSPSLPSFSFELLQKVFPDAITIALLGAIESLLSAVVADGITGHRHRSNCELIAQGCANIGSVLFGGIPATGAIARTSANIRLGATTPLAGMIHAATLFLILLYLSPLVGKIPLAALSAVLVFVAWTMSELPHFIEILKGQWGDAAVLLITFLLTVFIDLAVAVQVGVILAAVIFLKRMTDKTSLESCKVLLHEGHETGDKDEDDILLKRGIPEDITLFEINGPFFYSVADLLEESLMQQPIKPRVYILNLAKTPLIDATGLRALKKFSIKCSQNKILFLLAGVNEKKRDLFEKADMNTAIPKQHWFQDIDEALAFSAISAG